MMYTQQEKAKMDALLDAFREYVDGHPDFDILYSEKAGFLRICVGESADHIYFPIQGFRDMLAMFVDDLLQDAEERNECCSEQIRQRLMPIVRAFGADALALVQQRLENTGK